MCDEATEECVEEDHSEVTDEFEADFYILDCATITNVKKHNKYISGKFSIKNRDYEEDFDEYSDFLGDRLLKDKTDLQAENAHFEGNLYVDDGGYTRLQLQQVGEDVGLNFTHYYP